MDWSKFPIHKHEAMYILFASIFAMAWFVGLLPLIVGELGEDYAIIQFLIFNVGLYFFLFIFLKAIATGKLLDGKMDSIFEQLKTSLGLTFLILGLDIWLPPYSVNFDGVLASGLNLGVSASDYIIGLLWSSVGVGGTALYIITYIVFPVLFLVAAAKLLPNFTKKL